MFLDLLCGPIASGKSTYCRQAAQDGAIILNDDSIVTSVHAGDYRLYNEKLKPLYKSVENSLVCTTLAMGLRLVVDRPNHTMKMRRRYIGLAHSFDIPVRLVMFKREIPQVHGERRFKSDARGHSLDYWVKVAEYHDKIFEVPDASVEQFDELIEWDFVPSV